MGHEISKVIYHYSVRNEIRNNDAIEIDKMHDKYRHIVWGKMQLDLVYFLWRLLL